MDKIPTFPTFRRLSLEDQEQITSFSSAFPPFSDYNFASLHCYNVADRNEVSWLHGNLVIKFQAYTSDVFFYSFLGRDRLPETASTLLQIAQVSGVAPELRLIPETVALGCAGNPSFVVVEDEDNSDYILSLSDLSLYAGEKFTNKRNHCNKFVREYGDRSVVTLCLTRDSDRLQIEAFCTELAARKSFETYSSNEMAALKRLLDDADRFNLVCLGVFILGKLKAFIICEKLDNRIIIGHFEKSDLSISGIQPFLIQELAKSLLGSGYEFFNYEQDLGIEGLRIMKRRFRPAFFLKKFVIRTAQQQSSV